MNNGARKKYYVENNHPAIIDAATFAKVQEELAYGTHHVLMGYNRGTTEATLDQAMRPFSVGGKSGKERSKTARGGRKSGAYPNKGFFRLYRAEYNQILCGPLHRR